MPAQQHQVSQPASADEVRTLWIGDLQYYMDENYLMSCFPQTGEVFNGFYLLLSGSFYLVVFCFDVMFQLVIPVVILISQMGVISFVLIRVLFLWSQSICIKIRF